MGASSTGRQTTCASCHTQAHTGLHSTHNLSLSPALTTGGHCGPRKTQVCSPFTNQHSLLFHSLLLSIEGALLAGVFGESQLLTRGAGLLPPAGQVVHWLPLLLLLPGPSTGRCRGRLCGEVGRWGGGAQVAGALHAKPSLRCTHSLLYVYMHFTSSSSSSLNINLLCPNFQQKKLNIWPGQP